MLRHSTRTHYEKQNKSNFTIYLRFNGPQRTLPRRERVRDRSFSKKDT